jgi:hypothetical protein
MQARYCFLPRLDAVRDTARGVVFGDDPAAFFAQDPDAPERAPGAEARFSERVPDLRGGVGAPNRRVRTALPDALRPQKMKTIDARMTAIVSACARFIRYSPVSVPSVRD